MGFIYVISLWKLLYYHYKTFECRKAVWLRYGTDSVGFLFCFFCFVFMLLVLGFIELLESVDFSFSSSFEYFQPLFLQILSLFLSVSYDVSNYTHIRSLKVLKFSDTLFIKKNFFFLSASFLIVCVAMCCWVLFGDTVTLLGKSLIFWILILRFVRQDQNSVNSRANYSPLGR